MYRPSTYISGVHFSSADAGRGFGYIINNIPSIPAGTNPLSHKLQILSANRQLLVLLLLPQFICGDWFLVFYQEVIILSTFKISFFESIQREDRWSVGQMPLFEKSFHDTTKIYYELSYYYNYNNKDLAVHGANVPMLIQLWCSYPD